MVFLDDDALPIERFVFKLNVNQSYSSKVQQADLEFSLRSFLIKLPLSEPLTKVLPPSKYDSLCSFFLILLPSALDILEL